MPQGGGPLLEEVREGGRRLLLSQVCVRGHGRWTTYEIPFSSSRSSAGTGA
jgi:hypothetical protein